MDEEGWFHATEETINQVDEMLTHDDEEFANVLTTYTEARGALAKARVARGFYPWWSQPTRDHNHDLDEQAEAKGEGKDRKDPKEKETKLQRSRLPRGQICRG